MRCTRVICSLESPEFWPGAKAGMGHFRLSRRREESVTARKRSGKSDYDRRLANSALTAASASAALEIRQLRFKHGDTAYGPVTQRGLGST